MVVGEIINSLCDRFGGGPNPDSPTVRRYLRYLTLTHRELLGMRGFGRLRRKVLTTSAVANSPFMVMPQASVAIIAIADRTTQRILDEVSIQDIRFRDPGLTNIVANPDQYAIINYSSPVAKDPSAASSLYVISDSTTDGAGVSAVVEGVITGGYSAQASIAMNGTTGVNISATISTWVSPTKFRLSVPAKGNVTLREGSGVGTELARITPGRTSARYTQVHLLGIPSTAVTYYCDVELHVEDFVDYQDEALLPEDFHDILEIGAAKKELKKREKTSLWNIEDAAWRQRISDLRAFLSRKGGVGLGPRRQRGWSQLGPNFVAGS